MRNFNLIGRKIVGLNELFRDDAVRRLNNESQLKNILGKLFLKSNQSLVREPNPIKIPVGHKVKGSGNI